MYTARLLYGCLNPYDAGAYFGQYKIMQKKIKWLKPWYIGTHLRVLSESYLMNTNMTLGLDGV